MTNLLSRCAVAALIASASAITLTSKAEASFEFTTAKAEVNHSFETSRPNNPVTLEATCPEGYTVVGGGFYAQSDNNFFRGRVWPVQARRVSGRTYRVTWRYRSEMSQNYDDSFYLTAHAYCLQK